jgi:hypothetical protein
MDARPGGFGSPPAGGQVVPATSQPLPAAPTTLDTVEGQLARLAELAVAEHVQIFAGIHQQLTDALAVTGGSQGSGGHPQPGHGQPVQRSR